MQSENAEMYLVTMALLEELGNPTPIPLSLLAEELDVQVVSVNQMVRKLEEDELVIYLPYKGVSFTDHGAQLAQAILRQRRLWETFFVEHLGYPPQEADTLACRMEHITDPEIVERLSQFLDHPKASPTGKMIPHPGDQNFKPRRVPLSTLLPGQDAVVAAVNTDSTTSSFLQAQNIQPGERLKLLAVSSENVWLVSTGGITVSLTDDIAPLIIISAPEVD